MTLLENSSWFSHIQMPEKLDYGLTNSQLPHQARRRPGAPRSSCPTSSGVAGGGCDGLGCCDWRQGVRLWQRAVSWQLNLLLRWGDRPAPRQTVGTRAQLADPFAGFASPLAGGPAIVCHRAALEMAANGGKLLTSSPTARATHERKTHSWQKTEMHMAGNNISFVQ